MNVLLGHPVESLAGRRRQRMRLAPRREALAKAVLERRCQRISRRVSQLALQRVSRRVAFAFDLRRITDHHHGTDCVLDEVVGHAAENRASHLTHAASTRYDHRSRHFVGDLADHLARFASRRPQHSGYLDTDDNTAYLVNILLPRAMVLESEYWMTGMETSTEKAKCLWPNTDSFLR
jgi:hypothetical protein